MTGSPCATYSVSIYDAPVRFDGRFIDFLTVRLLDLVILHSKKSGFALNMGNATHEVAFYCIRESRQGAVSVLQSTVNGRMKASTSLKWMVSIAACVGHTQHVSVRRNSGELHDGEDVWHATLHILSHGTNLQRQYLHSMSHCHHGGVVRVQNSDYGTRNTYTPPLR